MSALEDIYYWRVREHLERTSAWGRWPLPPAAKEAVLRRAVRGVLRRFFGAYGPLWDPEEFDWEAWFECIIDFETADDFLADLEAKGVVPPDVELELERMVDERVRAIRELMEEVRELEPRRMREIYEHAARLAGVEDRLSELERKLERAREEALRERRKAELYKKLLDEMKERMAELERELRAARELVLAEKVPPPPVRWKRVVFLVEYPKFSYDGVEYGPYKPGDAAVLPEPLADKLVAEGYAAEAPPPSPEEAAKKTVYQPVHVRRRIERFMGVDFKAYGPFKRSDFAELPLENARYLRRWDAVEFIEPHDFDLEFTPDYILRWEYPPGKVWRDVETRSKYWVLEGGRLRRVRTKRELKEMFRDRMVRVPRRPPHELEARRIVEELGRLLGVV